MQHGGSREVLGYSPERRELVVALSELEQLWQRLERQFQWQCQQQQLFLYRVLSAARFDGYARPSRHKPNAAPHLQRGLYPVQLLRVEDG